MHEANNENVKYERDVVLLWDVIMKKKGGGER